MESKKEITPEFQDLYEKVDDQTEVLANEILQIVAKNDIRLLKKVRNRLEAAITEIKDIT